MEIVIQIIGYRFGALGIMTTVDNKPGVLVKHLKSSRPASCSQTIRNSLFRQAQHFSNSQSHGSIVALMLEALNRRLADRQLRVELTDEAMDAIIDQGFDPVYGARPLKRFIQSRIETLVARRIIAADVKPGDTLTVQVRDGGLVVE